MLLRVLSLLTTVTAAVAGNGPSSLYTLLNGMTFSPPGYTIVAYQSCVQNQNQGNPCGTFTNYLSSNGQYTYQQYGPAACSGSCCREFHLTLACGATLQMSGVNENPTCTYSATLSLPQVCGVDMTVGNEIASVSPTAAPPTSTSTPTGSNTSSATLTASGTVTGSNTSSASATSTPLYQIFYTPFPSTTSTQTLTATSTPLFMITAYPTSSPVNVSVTSTPLYYMTAYPSYNPNNETTEDALASIIAKLPVSSNTATILGGVAVGVAGLAGIGFAVHYMRNGGTLKGLVQKAKDNQGKLLAITDQLPLTAAQKAALHNPTSLLPEVLQNPQSLVDKLPVPDALKEQLKEIVSPDALLAAVQDPAALKAQVQSLVQAQVNTQIANAHALMDTLPVPDALKEQIKEIVPSSSEALLAAVQDPRALQAHVQALVQEQVQAQIVQAQAQVLALVPADIVVAVADEKKA